ncbi:MAG: Fe-S-containing hydro-lyase [Deltaproteobacteria bacterium]|nr:Fe-S-containing hydro-lyase [Deltaproteobacteria bacterium]
MPYSQPPFGDQYTVPCKPPYGGNPLKEFSSDRIIELKTPLSIEDIINLRSGNRISISGYIYTARDTAHKRLMELIKSDRELPFPLKGQVIYYVGPSPAPPGRVIGSAGPTTSYRMDPYTPKLLEMGLKGMIGKGRRSDAVREAMVRYRAIYMAATGGAGALISRAVRESTTVAYEDLGPEAVRRLKVERFPAIVVNDILGNDLYEKGQKQYQILS